MIKCTDCHKEKYTDEFYKRSNGKINSRVCKECTKERARINYRKVGNSYDLTEKGVFRVMYKTQKRHQRLRGHGDMPYTKKQLVEWCKSNGFDGLFIAWVESGYKSSLKPSVDRIDDFNGYSFDNIRLGTWQDNRNHQVLDIKEGKGTSGKRCKALLKLDRDMKVVCEYVSYSSASRDMGYSLEYQIKKGVRCRSGFYWKYK